MRLKNQSTKQTKRKQTKIQTRKQKTNNQKQNHERRRKIEGCHIQFRDFTFVVTMRKIEPLTTSGLRGIAGEKKGKGGLHTKAFPEQQFTSMSQQHFKSRIGKS